MILEKPIELTQTAINEIKDIIRTKNIGSEYGLRIGLKGAGCGATYLIGFDHKLPTDDTFEVEDIKILIDRKHLMYIFGLELGFEDGDEGQGFTFSRVEK